MSATPYRDADAVTAIALVEPRVRSSWWGRVRCYFGGHVLTIAAIERWLLREPASCPRCGVVRASPLLGGWSEPDLAQLDHAAEAMQRAEERRRAWMIRADRKMRDLTKAEDGARPR